MTARLYREPHARIARALAGAKRRAKQKGIPFDLEVADLLPLPEKCPVLGIELDYFAAGHFRHNSWSLDRIRPALGYVRGNVLVISHRANALRKDASLAELEAVTEYAKRLELGPPLDE